jgi:hypothetical protein
MNQSQTLHGNLLFRTGMLPTEGGAAAVVSRLGADVNIYAVARAEHRSSWSWYSR